MTVANYFVFNVFYIDNTDMLGLARGLDMLQYECGIFQTWSQPECEKCIHKCLSKSITVRVRNRRMISRVYDASIQPINQSLA